MSTSRERELLSAYLDGEVPDPWNSRVRRVVEEQPERTRDLERYRAVQDLLQKDRPASVDEAQKRVWARLEQRLPLSAGSAAPEAAAAASKQNTRQNDRIAGSSHQHWWQQAVKIPIPAAAAAVFVLVFSAVLFRGGVSSSTNRDIAAILTSRDLVGYQLSSNQTEANTVSIGPVRNLAAAGALQQIGFSLGSPAVRDSGNSQLGADVQFQVPVDSIEQLVNILASQSPVRNVTITLPIESRSRVFSEPSLIQTSAIAGE